MAQRDDNCVLKWDVYVCIMGAPATYTVIWSLYTVTTVMKQLSSEIVLFGYGTLRYWWCRLAVRTNRQWLTMYLKLHTKLIYSFFMTTINTLSHPSRTLIGARRRRATWGSCPHGIWKWRRQILSPSTLPSTTLKLSLKRRKKCSTSFRSRFRRAEKGVIC